MKRSQWPWWWRIHVRNWDVRHIYSCCAYWFRHCFSKLKEKFFSNLNIDIIVLGWRERMIDGFSGIPEKKTIIDLRHTCQTLHFILDQFFLRSGRLFSYASSFVLFFCFTSHSFIRIARTLYTKSTFIFFLSLLLWLANSCTWLYTSGPFCFVQFCIPNVHTFYLPYLLLFCSVFLYDELNVWWFCMSERPHRSLFGSEWQKLLSECIS